MSSLLCVVLVGCLLVSWISWFWHENEALSAIFLLPDHVTTFFHHTALTLLLHRETGCTHNVVVPQIVFEGFLLHFTCITPFYYPWAVQLAQFLKCIWYIFFNYLMESTGDHDGEKEIDIVFPHRVLAIWKREISFPVGLETTGG